MAGRPSAAADKLKEWLLAGKGKPSAGALKFGLSRSQGVRIAKQLGLTQPVGRPKTPEPEGEQT